MEADGDLGLHVRQLLLDELRRRERLAEGAALKRVVARRVPAEFGGAERPPGDAVARVVEAGEGALEAGDARQEVLVGDEDVGHGDLAGDRGAQRELAFDLRRRQPLHAALEDEAADALVLGLGPDDHDVGDGRVADPHLGAVQDIAAVDLARAAFHAAGIGAVIRLGQAEAADPFAGGELRQVFLPLRLGAEGMDRVHHQRALHAHGRAIAAVDAFDLAGDEAVADIADAGAAIALDGRPEESERAHLVHDLAVEALLAERALDARHELALRIGARAVAHHALVLGQLLLEEQRVLPVEARLVGAAGRRLAGGLGGHRHILLLTERAERLTRDRE